MLLTYECTAEGSGTRFVRTLDYRFDGLGMRIANQLLREQPAQPEAAKGEEEELSPTRYGDWVRKGIAVDF